jgi:hypothetical protein
MGKTSLVEAACLGAVREGRELLTACGSELESGFAFGVVRQLFEHRLASVTAEERETLLSGRAAAARPCSRTTAPPLPTTPQGGTDGMDLGLQDKVAVVTGANRASGSR